MELKLEVLTDSTANIGVHNRIGSGRVRHLDVKWLWPQEAVPAGLFSLKEVGTNSNVSDLTTKHHRLRYTRGHRDAVSAANEDRTAAVNAVLRSWSTELDENVLRLWMIFGALDGQQLLVVEGSGVAGSLEQVLDGSSGV